MNRDAKAMQSKASKMVVGQRKDGRTPIAVWDVHSPSSDSDYIVWMKRNGDLACNCDFGRRNYHTGRVCSHIFAAKQHTEDWQHAKRVSFWPNEEDAKRQHRPRERFQDVHMTVRAAA